MFGKDHILLGAGEPNSEEAEFSIRCVRCKKMYFVTANIAALRKWENGALIQCVVPTMHKDNRELLVSGTCPKCWKESDVA